VRNVLVTGANGFIGKVLCERMLADGYQVRGAVRSAAQMTVLLSGVEGVMVGDVGPETDWSEALDGIEGIVHLAARVHVMRESAADPLATFRQVNVVGTERLARQAAEAGVKRMVYLSSVKVNGERTDPQITQITRIREKGTGDKGRGRRSEVRGRGKTEIRGQRSGIKTNSGIEGFRNLGIEGRKGRRSEVDPQITQITRIRKKGTEVGGRGSVSKEFFSEKDVPCPQDPYAVSKWEAEQGLMAIAEETGLEVVIIRPPLVYGPGVKANFLRLFKIVECGIPLPFAKIDNRRSFIYLDNMIDAIITCINHPGAAGQTFLISDVEDVSTPELIRRIALAMEKPAWESQQL
jgi:nucleoside-diphosphate-sugar epimerase